MKMRLVVLVSVAENHLDNDVIKSAKFRHDLLLAFSVFKIASSFALVNSIMPYYFSKSTMNVFLERKSYADA